MGDVADRALNLRRALSEDAPRRIRTLDQTYEEEDIVEQNNDETPSKKRKLDLGGRSISEVLPHIPLSADYEEDLIATQEYPDQTPEEAALAQGRCVYIDRISPDLSDTAIKDALTQSLNPVGVPKVDSLEVIRTQRSRHVHAFAILTTPVTEEGPIEIPVERDEYIRVHHASKQLRIPTPIKPCRTLHIRIYARRAGWSNFVTRMTWPGVLSVLELVSAGSTSNISMIADDRSTRSRTSHPSVLLCVFFAECESIEAAIRLHDTVHDQTTRMGETMFLVRADYARGDKRLHDTSENQHQLREKFNEAFSFGNSVRVGEQSAMCSGKDCPLPSSSEDHFIGLHELFEFGRKGSPEKRRRQDGRSPPRESPKKRPSKKHQPANDDAAPSKIVVTRGVSQVELPDNGSAWSFGRK